jgi:hypothetical protein
MRFKPLRRAQWFRTGNAAVWACCFLGRCFVVRRCGKQTRICLGKPLFLDAKSSPRGQDSRRSDRPAPQSAVHVRAQIDAANGPMSGPHPCTDAAHDPSGAALCRDRSEQASRPAMRLAHETGAWKFECTAHSAWWAARGFNLRDRLAKDTQTGSLGVNYPRKRTLPASQVNILYSLHESISALNRFKVEAQNRDLP